MCALFGWLDYKGIVSYKTLRKLTQKLANAAEVRGTDATGIAYNCNCKINIQKKPKPAHKMKLYFPMHTKAVLGHTRFATQGDNNQNYNNHPFKGSTEEGSFAMAHNGVIRNDKSLRKNHHLPQTKIETDSYIAVQLAELKNSLSFDTLKFVAEEITGSFVLTYLDNKNNLYFVKGDNPLYLVHFEQLGLYVYASTKEIFKNAIKKTELAKHKYSVIEATEGDILKINSDGVIERDSFQTKFKSLDLGCSYPYYSGLYDLEEDYETDIDVLLETCSAFNLSEEDIALLLDFGYDIFEIEDLMMTDMDALRTAIEEIKECMYYDNSNYNYEPSGCLECF